MDRPELYAIIAGCVTVIGGLIGVAYSNLNARVDRMEKQRAEDMVSVWGAIDEQREDTKKILATMVTKDDLNRTEERIVRALRPNGFAPPAA